VTLKTEGKVSDQVYNEVLNEIGQRYETIFDKLTEINKASDGKTARMKEELKNLRYQLESLEVRYAVGSVQEDQYKMMRAGLLMRIQELEELLSRMAAVIQTCTENTGKSESIIGRRKRVTPTQPLVSSASQSVKKTESQQIDFPQVQKDTSIQESKKSTKKAVKNCQRCGAENPENAVYCYNCGAKL
jgi:ribosomal protein L40E